MKSKTSYFNKAVFKKDMIQFWALWAMEILLAITVFVMPVISRARTEAENNVKNMEGISNNVGEAINDLSVVLANPLLICVLAIVVAVVVFHYTFNSRDMYMIHSFPVKRECLFISHYIAGLVMMLIPYILGFIGYIAVADIYKTGMAKGIMLMAFEVFAMIVLFYSIACAVLMVSGNSMMAIVIYGVINILYIAMYLLFCSLNQMFSYADRGVQLSDILQNKFIWLSPIAYFFDEVGFSVIGPTTGRNQTAAYERYVITGSDIVPFVGFLVAGILIFAVSLMLYKYRRSETVGDMVSFKWCKPVFRTVFSISGGVAFAVIFYSLYFGSAYSINRMHYLGKRTIYFLIFVLICVSLCYFISEMILRKTFFVWKKFSKTNFAVVFGAVFIILVLEATGVIGIKIPDINNVSSLEISSANELLYTDKDDIASFIKLNKEIEEKRTVVKDADNICSVEFCYTLKNGSKRRFAYSFENEDGSIAYDIVKCANNSRQKFEAVFSRAYKEKDFKLNKMEYEHQDDDIWNTDYIPYDKANEVYDAIKKDISVGNIDVLYLGYGKGVVSGQIQFNPLVSQKLADKYKMSDAEKQFFNVNKEEVYVREKTLYITENAENTVAVITKLENDGMLSEPDASEEY